MNQEGKIRAYMKENFDYYMNEEQEIINYFVDHPAMYDILGLVDNMTNRYHLVGNKFIKQNGNTIEVNFLLNQEVTSETLQRLVTFCKSDTNFTQNCKEITMKSTNFNKVSCKFIIGQKKKLIINFINQMMKLVG